MYKMTQYWLGIIAALTLMLFTQQALAAGDSLKNQAKQVINTYYVNVKKDNTKALEDLFQSTAPIKVVWKYGKYADGHPDDVMNFKANEIGKKLSSKEKRELEKWLKGYKELGNSHRILSVDLVGKQIQIKGQQITRYQAEYSGQKWTGEIKDTDTFMLEKSGNQVKIIELQSIRSFD